MTQEPSSSRAADPQHAETGTSVSLTASRQERGAGVRPLQGRGVNRPAITSEAIVASALAGELSETTAATVAKASTTSQALALVLGSPEFQRR